MRSVLSEVVKAASYLGYKVPSRPRRELQITGESPNEHVGSPAPEKGSCRDKTCMSHKVALHGSNGLSLSCGPGSKYHTAKAHGDSRGYFSASLKTYSWHRR